MAVKIGSARIDENGKAMGGQAGDQTGKEVSTQDWYLSSKGWRVFRAKDPEKRDKIAQAMEAACANPNIGYDQGQRTSLYSAVKYAGFNPAAAASPVETDCSALVRVCCAFAGIMMPNFYTGDQAKTMLDTGEFIEMTGAKYTDSSKYLMRGDVLVTKTKGHTVVVLSKGSKAKESDKPETDAPKQSTSDGTIKMGAKGDAVKRLQEQLLALGYQLPKWGADGDFGEETLAAVKAFQKDRGLEVDGIVGPKTKAALDEAVAKQDKKHVKVTGATVNIRASANLEAKILGVVKSGELFDYLGEDSSDGWHHILYKNQKAWISGKYSEVVA